MKKKIYKRTCINPECKKEFIPRNKNQVVCDYPCAFAMTLLEQNKRNFKKRKNVLSNGTKKEKSLLKSKEKAKFKDMKKEVKETLSIYIKRAQDVFNYYIKLRDFGLGCISCGVFKCEEWHAGHYIATTKQILRLYENNCHKQCSKCNTHLRGNLINYRINLINRIGLKEVEYMESIQHNEWVISISELKEFIKKYKEKINQLKNK